LSPKFLGQRIDGAVVVFLIAFLVAGTAERETLQGILSAAVGVVPSIVAACLARSAVFRSGAITIMVASRTRWVTAAAAARAVMGS